MESLAKKMTEEVKIIVITGAAKGLGLAISRKAIESGYKVIGIGRNVSEEFMRLPTDFREFIQFDLLQTDKIASLVDEIVEKSNGTPYGLVNNAAIGLDGLLATQHITDISKLLKLNLEAPIILTKYLSRKMIKRKSGRIVNISSIIAQTGYNGLSVYASTKSGIEGFTRSFAREIGRAGITVNCVAPGFMETQMTAGIKVEQLAAIKRRAPLGLPKTEHVASTVLHLFEKNSERITGSIITVDGGSTA